MVRCPLQASSVWDPFLDFICFVWPSVSSPCPFTFADLSGLQKRRQWRVPAAVWQLWSWLPHVLPQAQNYTGARGRLVLSNLHSKGPNRLLTSHQGFNTPQLVGEAHWLVGFLFQDQGEAQQSSKKRTRVKRKRYEEESSEEETMRRSSGMSTRHKDTPPAPLPSRHSGEGGSTKRRRMTTRNQPDLAFCEWVPASSQFHIYPSDVWEEMLVSICVARLNF